MNFIVVWRDMQSCQLITALWWALSGDRRGCRTDLENPTSSVGELETSGGGTCPSSTITSGRAFHAYQGMSGTSIRNGPCSRHWTRQFPNLIVDIREEEGLPGMVDSCCLVWMAAARAVTEARVFFFRGQLTACWHNEWREGNCGGEKTQTYLCHFISCLDITKKKDMAWNATAEVWEWMVSP